MTLKAKAAVVGGFLFLLAASFVAGRYSRPAEQITQKGEVRIEYRDRIVYRDRKTKKHTETTTTSTKQPDGTTTTTTKTVQDDGSETKTTDRNRSKETDRKTDQTVVKGGRPDWRVSGLVAAPVLQLSPSTLQYGAAVERRLLGTVWAGGFALVPPHDPRAAMVGVSLTLEF